MKGLFYCTAKMNRGYFIAAFITLICSAVLGSVVLYNVNEARADDYGFGFLCVTFLPFLPMVILCEFLARDVEHNIKCGFFKYTLSSISRGRYTLSLLLTNLFVNVLGLAVGYLLLFIFRLFGGEANVLPFYFILLPMFALLAGAVEWICMPVTIKLKSAEKAGLIVGIVLGFGTVLPVTIALKSSDFVFDITKIATVPALMIMLGAAAAVYALIYAIIMRMLKRGVI